MKTNKCIIADGTGQKVFGLIHTGYQHDLEILFFENSLRNGSFLIPIKV